MHQKLLKKPPKTGGFTQGQQVTELHLGDTFTTLVLYAWSHFSNSGVM